MKYNTISTSSLSSERNKPTYNIYADTDCAREKMASSEAEIVSIRDELELVQRALKIQTRRCRQLVAEYTKRLQLKEQQYEAEKRLRDDQLSRVLRALLVFEARLRQEQKYISHQLEEKDYAIKKQQTYIQKLLSNHYCKNCNQYYSPSINLGSLNSSLEYVVTDHPDYQSSTFESLDSSSETYASISEKDSDSRRSAFANSISSEENMKTGEDVIKSTFIKNKNKDSLNKRTKRMGHRKSISNYFEVLKMRNDNHSPSSNDDNTSMDYENLNSLQLDNTSESMSENMFIKEVNQSESDMDIYSGLDDAAINVSNDNSAVSTSTKKNQLECAVNDENHGDTVKQKITDTIPVFDVDSEVNDNWYASASEQEDEEHRGVYRNNPVLECMNQILMQNINDPLVSPPKTPNAEKKFNKNGKKVKFSDEEDSRNGYNTNDSKLNEIESNYYETPIQRPPNFYETPQSIYSNDYEQILSQCSETFQKHSQESNIVNGYMQKLKNDTLSKKQTYQNKENGTLESNCNHYYIAMDTKSEQDELENKIIRKSKILRTPPALPPKPANLLSKYKIQNLQYGGSKDKLSEKSLDSEPDYCSISEINLPTISKSGALVKNSIITDSNPANLEAAIKKLAKISNDDEVLQSSQKVENEIPSPSQYKPVSLNEPIFNLKINKNTDNANTQSPIKIDNILTKKTPSPEIPKLPQVTEIIIPEETDSKSEICVSHDNYVKNNTQILQQKPNHTSRTRPIQMGSTVSSLIASFNNKQLLSEINHSPTEKHRKSDTMFSSFENLQNLETRLSLDSTSKQTFENFDLSQNFEEFKLDDCEIEDFSNNCHDNVNEIEIKKVDLSSNRINSKLLAGNINFSSPTRVELVRATNDVISTPSLNINSLQQFKKKLELEKNRVSINNQIKVDNSTTTLKYTEPTYEHFLECTGLSSKSILTPSRLISNHKTVLKPKDVKLRTKVNPNNVLEREEVAVKYWSEPFL